MSLLKRIPTPTSGQGQPTPPAAPQPPGSRPPTPPQPGTPQRPFNSPFGARPNSRIFWEFVPAGDTIVLFEMPSAVEAIFNLIDQEPPTPPAAETEHAPDMPSWLVMPPLPLAAALTAALEANSELEERLKAQLDAAWAEANLVGAALIYPWRQEVKQALTARLQAIEQPTVVLRATDPLLVLNVLSRSRTHILLGNAPCALERAFLERVLYTDDPRLVALAQASGTIEEPLEHPQPEEAPAPQEEA